ncbi:MAG: hypothetical protein DMG13_20705, partial [Acidobacteria bacterium]
MRVERNSRRRAILGGVVVIATGIFCWTAVQRLQWETPSEPSTGSARLVSMEQLPDSEFCASGEATSAIATLSQEFEDNNLFAALGGTSVHAEDTVEVTRPPV